MLRIRELHWRQVLRMLILTFPLMIGLGAFYFLGLVMSLTSSQISSSFVLLGLVFVPFGLVLLERTNCLKSGDGLPGLVWDQQRVGLRYGVYVMTWLGQLSLLVLLAQILGWHVQWILSTYVAVELPLQLYSAGLLMMGWWMFRTWDKGLISINLFAMLVLGVGIASLLTQQIQSDPVYLPFRLDVNIFYLVALMVSCFWVVDWLVRVKHELHQPNRHWWMVLFGSIGLLVGGLWLLSVVIIQYLDFLPTSYAPLLELLLLVNPWKLPLVPMTYMVTVGLLLWVAMQLTVQRIDSLLAMNEAGVMMLPVAFFEWWRFRFNGLRWLSLGLVLLLNFLPLVEVTQLVSLCWLGVVVLLIWPDVWSRQPVLPARRRFRLPLHPLIPAMVLVLGLALAQSLLMNIWLLVSVLAIVLISHYWLRARKRMVEHYQLENTQYVRLSEQSDDDVSISNTVLLILPSDEKIEVSVKYAIGFVQRLHATRLLVQYLGDEFTTARSTLETILETLKPEVLVDGLFRNDKQGVLAIKATLDEVEVRYVLFDSGIDFESMDWQKLYWTAVANMAILPESDADQLDGLLLLASRHDVMNTPPLLLRSVSQKSQAVPVIYEQTGVNGRERHLPQTSQIVSASTTELRSTVDARLTPGTVAMLVADYHPVLGHYRFNQTFLTAAKEAGVPYFLYRYADSFWQRWLRLARLQIQDILPQINRTEQMERYRYFNTSGSPSIDFYVLIVLSSIIATSGLIQNSAAVIIGAMLVAPLMTPILSMAASMVQGSFAHLRVGAEATIKGIALAIGTSLGLSLLVSHGAASSEILNRTQPQFLDLIVALVSGAAAAYAMSRKDLAAALPGVAIAAALVPPLCVVGYGLATGQLDVAMGSGLLFTTNLIAIVFAAAITLLALGYRPLRRDLQDELWRSLQFSLGSLVVITIVLSWLTVPAVQKAALLNKVTIILDQPLVEQTMQVSEVRLERSKQGYDLYLLVYTYTDKTLTDAQIRQLFEQLQATSDENITVHVTLLEADRSIITQDGITVLNPSPTPTLETSEGE